MALSGNCTANSDGQTLVAASDSASDPKDGDALLPQPGEAVCSYIDVDQGGAELERTNGETSSMSQPGEAVGSYIDVDQGGAELERTNGETSSMSQPGQAVGSYIDLDNGGPELERSYGESRSMSRFRLLKIEQPDVT